MEKEVTWNHSIFSPPSVEKMHQSLPESIAKIADLFPNSPAILFEKQTYSFLDLCSRIAGLSREIDERVKTPGPIALVQTVGFDAIAAWFACGLSGRAFLLLDPDQPQTRLREIIEAASCSLVLADATTSKILVDLPPNKLLISNGQTCTFRIDKRQNPEEPAIIFPTSGSTGDPKLITYAAATLQVKVQSSIQRMQVPQGARVFIAGSHANYGFLHHALVFLLSGGAVCLADIKSKGFNAILHAITYQGARHIRFTPSLFRKLSVLPQSLEPLQLLEGVRFSGEPLLTNDLKLAQSILNPTCLVQNVYGSTESALFIWSSKACDIALTTTTAPIGKIYPLSSFAIRPLNDGIEESLTGELLIRSRFHALGDWKKDRIDKERFPLLEGSVDERVYQTGDVVKQLPNGDLIHLGRFDRMVKIRGNRVFLTEIEFQLRGIPGVTTAVVIDQVEQGNVLLYGFITTDSTTIKSEDIRATLALKIPSFMIPSHIEILNQIPLMPGGKVDFQALLSRIPTRSTESSEEQHVTNDYSRLIQIWDSVLWTGAHKYDSDFHALGGDSLNFMILIDELENTFGKNLPLEDVRSNCTLTNLTEILHIENPQLQQDKKYETVQASLLRPSLKPSRGIAMSVPGFRGYSGPHPFHQAGFFEDFDIWKIDFPIKEGSMQDANRYWKAAQEIIEGMNEGSIPTPRILFGSSFGGGFAWLLGKLLSGSPFCPEFVVMVDAPPLHRRHAFRTKALKKALHDVASFQSPSVIHLQRAPLPVFGKRGMQIDVWDWKPEDTISLVVNIPVVGHSEMSNWKILHLAKEVVDLFLIEKKTNNLWQHTIYPTNLFEFKIFVVFNGNQSMVQKVMNELVLNFKNLSFDSLMHLSVLFYLHNDKKKAIELLNYGVTKWSNSGTLHYLSNRMKRNPDMLIPAKDIPKIFPWNIIVYETRLSAALNTVVKKPFSVRLFYFILDVIIAAFFTRFIAKLKHKSF
ncbi:MAG: non-ribosomal peptide synthetase [Spirosomataceae bacterium]